MSGFYGSLEHWTDALPSASARQSADSPPRPRRLRSAAHAFEPGLEDMVDVGYLLDVFEHLRRHGGQSSGADGVGFDQIGRREMADVLRDRRRRILANEWTPDRPRVVRIPKPNGGERILRIPSVVDRVIYTALNSGMRTFWETRFSNRSHGFRPQRSHLTLLASLEKEILARQRFVIAIDDVERAFDNVPIDGAMAAHQEHLRDPRLLAFIQSTLRGSSAQRRTVGVDQGNAYAPIVLNVLLTERFDRLLEAAEASHSLSYLRYADNLVAAADGVAEGHYFLELSASLLEPFRMRLKGEDGAPRDIREAPIELLGFRMQCHNGSMVYEAGRKSWQKLDLALEHAHEAEDPALTARNAIRGFVSAMGPIFATVGDDYWTRIRAHASRFAFHEVDCIDTLREIGASARQRWIDLRRRIHEENGSS